MRLQYATCVPWRQFSLTCCSCCCRPQLTHELTRVNAPVHCLWLCASQTALLQGSEACATGKPYISTMLQKKADETPETEDLDGDESEWAWNIVSWSMVWLELAEIMNELSEEVLQSNNRIGNITGMDVSEKDGHIIKLAIPFKSSEIWARERRKFQRRMSYQEMEQAQELVINFKSHQIDNLIENVKDSRSVEDIMIEASEGNSLWPVEQIAGCRILQPRSDFQMYVSSALTRTAACDRRNVV